MEYYIKAFQNYAVFTGRASRKEYWHFFVINFIISVLISIIESIIKIQGFGFFYTFITILPSFAAGVRRIHDVGKSGWFIFIPIYNLVLLCTIGDDGRNLYGDDPKLSDVENDDESSRSFFN